jgi:hypothetical protein
MGSRNIQKYTKIPAAAGTVGMPRLFLRPIHQKTAIQKATAYMPTSTLKIGPGSSVTKGYLLTEIEADDR